MSFYDNDPPDEVLNDDQVRLLLDAARAASELLWALLDGPHRVLTRTRQRGEGKGVYQRILTWKTLELTTGPESPRYADLANRLGQALDAANYGPTWQHIRGRSNPVTEPEED